VYEVYDDEITIFVIAVGKREKGFVYTKPEDRKNDNNTPGDRQQKI